MMNKMKTIKLEFLVQQESSIGNIILKWEEMNIFCIEILTDHVLKFVSINAPNLFQNLSFLSYWFIYKWLYKLCYIWFIRRFLLQRKKTFTGLRKVFQIWRKNFLLSHPLTNWIMWVESNHIMITCDSTTQNIVT